MINVTKLKNGVTIIGEHIPSVRSIAFGIWVENGSRHETEDTKGISHFIEHMLFKGTEKRTAKDIANEMDYVGGQINAFTSREYTCYHTRTLDTHFEKALDVLADMFFNSVFDDEEIKKESRVILEEISMYEDSPEDLAHEIVNERVFKGNPLSYPILGTEETVSSFNSSTIKNYFKERYAPDNTYISIAGNYDKERIVESIEKYFGEFTVSKNSAVKDITPIYQPDIITREKDVEQVHICLSFPGIRHGIDETYSLSIFDAIFGGGMSSRLFQKIREEMGLVYSIYSCPTTYKQTGIYSVYAGMNANCAESVIELVAKEIKLLRDDRITNEQVIKTKEQIKSSFIISLESTSNRMISIGRAQMLLGKVQTADEIIKKIDAVTVDGIYEVIEKIFDFDKICAAAVGKVKNVKISKVLK